MDKLSINNTLALLMEKEYERISGETWADLEKGVRARHPYLFEVLDALERKENRMDALENKRWWEFWK